MPRTRCKEANVTNDSYSNTESNLKMNFPKSLFLFLSLSKGSQSTVVSSSEAFSLRQLRPRTSSHLRASCPSLGKHLEEEEEGLPSISLQASRGGGEGGGCEALDIQSGSKGLVMWAWRLFTAHYDTPTAHREEAETEAQPP